MNGTASLDWRQVMDLRDARMARLRAAMAPMEQALDAVRSAIHKSPKGTPTASRIEAAWKLGGVSTALLTNMRRTNVDVAYAETVAAIKLARDEVVEVRRRALMDVLSGIADGAYWFYADGEKRLGEALGTWSAEAEAILSEPRPELRD
jgi:hypothetical protein